MEYKIIDGFPEDVQKILNQWRHKYKITILGQNSFQADLVDVNFCPYKSIWVVIILSREEKC